MQLHNIKKSSAVGIKPPKCANCPNKLNRTVGYRGNPAAKIVIVGESPSAGELQRGMPFMGPSGKVVEGCIPSHINPDDILWVNAIQCFTPKTKDAKKNTQVTETCGKACGLQLHQIIQAYPRDVILAFGNAALKSLTGDYDLKITQNRGKVFYNDLCSRGIVAAVHPNYLLRGNGSYLKFKADINYAFDLAAGLPIKKPIKPEWRVASTEKEVQQFIDETFYQVSLTDDFVLGADIETGGFNFMQDETLVLGWCADPAEVFLVPEDLLKAGALKYRDFSTAHLYGGPLKWCWHNGKFDVKFLRQLGYRAAVDHDTMLLSYIQNEQRGMHDLEQVASDEIGSPNYKDMLKPYLPNSKTSYRVIPKDVLNKYASFDVSDTKQVFDRMYPRVQKDPIMFKAYHKVLLPASELLSKVETNGIFVDKTQQESNMAHYEAIIAEHRDVLNQVVLDIDPEAQYKDSKTNKLHLGINPNSPKQVSTLLYTTLELGRAGMSTDADTLEKLPQVPAVKALRAFRKAAKRYGTYVKNIPALINTDGRIHSSFLIHGTATGRLSSRDPNLQNQPRDYLIRNQYAAEPG